MKRELSGIIVIAMFAVNTLSYSQEEKSFKVWLDELKTEAESRGFSRKSVESAFSEIREPVKSIVAKDRSQPEVVESYSGYIDRRVTCEKHEPPMRSWRADNPSRSRAISRE